MRRWILPTVALLLLAGCTGGGPGGDYPDDYMLSSYGVPDGYELVDTDAEFWQSFGGQWGMEQNPGWADPESLESDEDELPPPERVYAAFYITEGWEPESDEQPTVVSSLAAEMASSDDAEEAAAAEGFCEDGGEDTYATAQRDDVIIAAQLYSGPDDLTQHLQRAAGELRSATGASDVC